MKALAKPSLFHILKLWINNNKYFDGKERLYHNLNPLPAKLLNWNFHPLEVVSRLRDPQFQVGENYSDLTKCRSAILKSC